MQVQPYLFFEGRCEEALKFYGSAVGAKVSEMMHFKDNPEPQGGAGCADGMAPPPDKVMHATFTIGDTTLMASDGMSSGKPDFKGISLSITGGQVQMPLGKTFFASSFGMVADRFGVSWMVIALP